MVGFNNCSDGASVTLAELEAEFRDKTIGIGIFAEITAAVHAVVNRYDPRIYGGGSASWNDAAEDVVQQVVLDRLLSQKQLAYAFAVAGNLDHFRRLLRRQVRNTLIGRRERDVVDNLLERGKKILEEEWFSRRHQGPARRYGPAADRSKEDRAPTEAELRTASLAIAALPQRRGGDPMERAPVIYDNEGLADLIRAFATSLPTTFSLGDLDRALRLVLTPWLLGELMSIEGAVAAPDAALTPDAEVEAMEIANTILSQLSGDDRIVLNSKLANASDAEVAAIVGVSRPTLAKRKKRVYDALAEQLDGVTDPIRDEVMRRLALALAKAATT